MGPGANDFAERLESAIDSGGVEAGDLVISQATAVSYAMQVEHDLARERAAHEQTRRALARAYDTIAAVRAALGKVQS